MVPLKNIVFIDNISTPMISKEFYNAKAEAITLEVSGSGGACSAFLETKSDMDSENWTRIGGINLTEYDLVEEIKEDGIYQFPLSGIQLLRINLETADGSIKIFGRLMSEGI